MKYQLSLIISVFCLLILFGCGSKKESEKTDEIPKETRDSLIIEMAGADSLTVLEQLEARHEIVSVPSAMGTFVKAIDNVENSRHVFWFYSVNDEMADIAADKYITRKGDVIKWHFRYIGTENEEPQEIDTLTDSMENADN